jgi:hypothetical protein
MIGSPRLVEVVREYLEHEGYRVVTASDGLWKPLIAFVRHDRT